MVPPNELDDLRDALKSYIKNVGVGSASGSKVVNVNGNVNMKNMSKIEAVAKSFGMRLDHIDEFECRFIKE